MPKIRVIWGYNILLLFLIYINIWVYIYKYIYFFWKGGGQKTSLKYCLSFSLCSSFALVWYLNLPLRLRKPFILCVCRIWSNNHLSILLPFLFLLSPPVFMAWEIFIDDWNNGFCYVSVLLFPVCVSNLICHWFSLPSQGMFVLAIASTLANKSKCIWFFRLPFVCLLYCIMCLCLWCLSSYVFTIFLPLLSAFFSCSHLYEATTR